MHRLLINPGRRIIGQQRMPYIQQPSLGLVDTLKEQLMDPTSSMRLAKTTASNRKLMGSVASPQRFVAPAGSNTPDQLAAGKHKVNAPRRAPHVRGRFDGDF